MIAFKSLIILIAAFAAVFLQSATSGVQRLIGTELDLLPALMVYASLTTGPRTVALLALCGGLWFDSLSANPFGITVLPLAAIGYVISRRRDLILHDQMFAQFVLGLAASAAAPIIALVLMLSAGRSPLLGWGTLWQIVALTLVGGALTPVLFKLFGLLTRTFDYRDTAPQSFRPDRQIRRGRN